ncbi:MAG: hypothetical protein JWM18_2701 [Chloroflexi bacterium]|jgi:hypothetical protein|nr:hypothetical protein [Chloroflexota bacterium]
MCGQAGAEQENPLASKRDMNGFQEWGVIHAPWMNMTVRGIGCPPPKVGGERAMAMTWSLRHPGHRTRRPPGWPP